MAATLGGTGGSGGDTSTSGIALPDGGEVTDGGDAPTGQKDRQDPPPSVDADLQPDGQQPDGQHTAAGDGSEGPGNQRTEADGQLRPTGQGGPLDDASPCGDGCTTPADPVAAAAGTGSFVLLLLAQLLMSSICKGPCPTGALGALVPDLARVQGGLQG
ncbi:MAG TPA: hypothetical protein VKG45_08010 [Actinomycetes bacterium]|nr:hypothetical protein [Actinomycetes bacterium]